MYKKSIALLNILKNRKLLLREMNRILFNVCILLWKMVYIEMDKRLALKISFFKFKTNDFYLYLLKNCYYQDIYIYIYV